MRASDDFFGLFRSHPMFLWSGKISEFISRQISAVNYLLPPVTGSELDPEPRYDQSFNTNDTQLAFEARLLARGAFCVCEERTSGQFKAFF